MKARHILGTMMIGVILTALGLNAQQAERIDHRTYPADFARINVGDAVEGRPGFTWQHDGQGWLHVCTNPYFCTPDTPVQRDVFIPGQTIGQPYPTFRAIVVSVGNDGGKTVVTARITRSPGSPAVGEYIAFDAARTQWFPIDINSLP